MLIKKLNIPIIFCLISLPTLIQASPLGHTSLSIAYNSAKEMVLSLNQASKLAEDFAAKGNITEANQILISRLNQEAKPPQGNFFNRPQSRLFLSYALPVLTNALKISALTLKTLGPLAFEKMKYKHFLHLIAKTTLLYNQIDSPTYLPLMDECKEVHCPPLDLINDQFFSAQKVMLLYLLSLGKEYHKTFYDSRIEVNFQMALYNSILRFITTSEFQTSWLCIVDLATKRESQLIELAKVSNGRSFSQKAEEINSIFQSTKQLILTIQNRDTCFDIEK